VPQSDWLAYEQNKHQNLLEGLAATS
jgi:hypothetical protein